MQIKITEAWLSKIAADGGELPDGERYAWDEELPGYGVRVGRRFLTLIVQHRVAGKQEQETIGRWGQPRTDGATWTEPRARKDARIKLGKMIAGISPREEIASEDGPTLGDAFDAHIESLRKRVKAGKRSEATIETFEKSKKYVDAWLDKPIAELKGSVLVELHEQIKRKAKPRANTKNEKGAALANRVITNVGTAWATLNKKLEGALGTWNPAKSVDKDSLVAKRVRILDEDLPDWAARVATMRSAIQRDGLMFALFTGLRSEDVRTIRFENFDEDERTLDIPDPKGGEARAFTIPLPKICVAILERRRTTNRTALGRADDGYAFPAIDADGEVGPIGDLRQQVHEGKKHTRFPSEDVHTLRRTWESVAHETGITELDQHVLSNHAYGSHNVNATYIAQHIDHLRACADRIERALRDRLDATPTKKRARGKLRAV